VRKKGENTNAGPLNALLIKHLVGKQLFNLNGGAAVNFEQLLRMGDDIRSGAASLVILDLHKQ